MSAVVVVVFVVDVDRYPMTNGSHAQNRQNGTIKTNKHQTAQSGNSSPWSGLFQVYYIFQKYLFFIFLFPKSARLVVFLLLWCLSALSESFVRTLWLTGSSSSSHIVGTEMPVCLPACTPFASDDVPMLFCFSFFETFYAPWRVQPPHPLWCRLKKTKTMKKKQQQLFFLPFLFLFFFFLVF